MIAETFTPGSSLLGGALIGAAAAGLLFADGKIAGVSGILTRALTPTKGDFAWRIAFLAGLPLGAAAAGAVTGDLHGFAITRDLTTLVVGGLLVGFGTAHGNGCTSGHGVCGLARGSGRSLVATVTFMVAGALTVFALRHVLGVT